MRLSRKLRHRDTGKPEYISLFVHLGRENHPLAVRRPHRMLCIHGVLSELRQIAALTINDEDPVAASRVTTTGRKCQPPAVRRPVVLSPLARAYRSGLAPTD